MKSIIIILLLTISLNAGDWSTTDQVLYSNLIILNVIDIGQTNYGLHKGYVEANPILGKHPTLTKLVVVKSLMLTMIYFIVDNINYKETALYVFNTIQLSVITYNSFKVGFNIKL